MKRSLLVPCLLSVGIACQPAEEPAPPLDLSPGVSRDLARHRAGTLGDVRIEISLSIPDSTDEPVTGRETIRVVRVGTARDLVLDFTAEAESVLGVWTLAPGSAEKTSARYRVENEHVIVSEADLIAGENAVEIEFTAGEGSLNRQRDYLYTLFVPDRARFALPCLDQPDLKARFRLELETPAAWRAVANAPLAQRRTAGERTTWTFAETAPLPTYLFSFAAGELEVETAERGGRTLGMLHRESDAEKLARNREAIFDLHATALAWLEEYTGIPYPFEKFDFVLVPSFQYGGMEHPGAILYRDSALLLDESATQDDRLRRASLIAHETAHMWFGDLVTMTWFDDVWMKEVFANFMAAKIVHPSFPEIDHELRFLLAHFPAAYEVDRSAGANPIRQQLDNLAQAGTLYGAIIYQKAPIVMRQLEMLVGEEGLRDGLREYLDAHRFGNASWPDLIATLDRRTDVDLAAWSRVWVGEPGRPEVATKLEVVDGRIRSLALAQSDPSGAGRLWTQRLDLAVGLPGAVAHFPVELDRVSVEVTEARGLPAPGWVLQGGQGYGRFAPHWVTGDYLLTHGASIEEPLLRGVAWLSLWDEMLEARVSPQALFDAALVWLGREGEELLVTRILRDLPALYWRFLTPALREHRAEELEELLWALLGAAPEPGAKSSYFRAFVATATSAEALARLTRVARRDLELEGLPLSEEDFITVAYELAVRDAPGAAEILAGLLERIENPDRRARVAFVAPALSADLAVRRAFFESLRDPANREQEPWVLDALGYLHHPLRAEASIGYVLPALELLEEIQRTGDIFFPKRWLDATLGGHGSREAARIVRAFLAARPDYPPRLRGKILQSADGLFRAARIRVTPPPA